MTIDWLHFTPYPAAIGGVLIGVAAVILIVFSGRIAGISGIIGGLLRRGGDAGWRIAFVAGLLAAPVLYGAVTAIPEIRIEAGTPMLLLAGLLVGLIFFAGISSLLQV